MVDLISIARSKLFEKGFDYTSCCQGSLIFRDHDRNITVILDIDIRQHKFSYHDYTCLQNRLMRESNSLFRFLLESEKHHESELNSVLSYLDGTPDIPPKSLCGQDRSTLVEGSVLEHEFEMTIANIYGADGLRAMDFEYPFIDDLGVQRSIDYVLHLKTGPVAIELNGVKFHHPLLIEPKKYRSQLQKQNSIVRSGIKLYRFSTESYQFEERFVEEVSSIVGGRENLLPRVRTYLDAPVKLYEHQENILDSISAARAEGANRFLVLLPTGTGKTQVMIEDYVRYLSENPSARLLVVVPSTAIKVDVTEKLCRQLVPGVSLQEIGESLKLKVVIQTYQGLSRCLADLRPDSFEYVAVDEAHHAVAPSYRRLIQRLNPRMLLGMTATDQRLDRRSLEEVFGRYENPLGLFEAIRRGLLVPLRVFRLVSGVDLSEVRFNGKEYNSGDLERTLMVESRNELIAATVANHFSQKKTGVVKQGLVFCVSIKHANAVAHLLNELGISAQAAHSGRANAESAIQAYRAKEIQFLCVCSMLSEGWDCPQTEIIVMARPTMSKVLYTQQLGRGTRRAEGKDCLWVIDVVDNYAAHLMPYSAHGVLGVKMYQPFGLLGVERSPTHAESLVIDYLYEEEQALVELDIETLEEKYPGHLSTEQAARELFISTDTLRKWVKDGQVRPSTQFLVGRNMMCLFTHEKITEIRIIKNLKVRTKETVLEDFWEFCRERDYTYSYKIVMMLVILESVDGQGECSIPKVIDRYRGFYLERLRRGLPADVPKCPYNSEAFLLDFSNVKKSFFQNPFEKFERKKFLYHDPKKDIERIAFSLPLWEKLVAGSTLIDLRKFYEEEWASYERERLKDADLLKSG